MNRPYRLGLTGSIGMGKSTTTAMFAAAGIPVWDADAAVHRAYARGGGGALALAAVAPDAVVGDAVDRDRLRAAVLADPGLLPRIEAAIHPLVTAARERFEAEHRESLILLFDIPLLYETKAETWLDGVLVVTAAPDVQRARVLARSGTTEAMFERVLQRQTPDAEKRARADFVIDTGEGLDAARAAVLALIERISRERGNA